MILWTSDRITIPDLWGQPHGTGQSRCSVCWVCWICGKQTLQGFHPSKLSPTWPEPLEEQRRSPNGAKLRWGCLFSPEVWESSRLFQDWNRSSFKARPRILMKVCSMTWDSNHCWTVTNCQFKDSLYSESSNSCDDEGTMKKMDPDSFLIIPTFGFVVWRQIRKRFV